MRTQKSQVFRPASLLSLICALAFACASAYAGTPTVTINVLNGTLTEGSGAVNAFRVKLSASQFTPTPVKLAFSGSATPGDDFTSSENPPQITIPALATSVTVQITPISDGDKECSENLVVTLPPGAGYIVGGSGFVDIEIRDAVFQPEFASSPTPGSSIVYGILDQGLSAFTTVMLENTGCQFLTMSPAVVGDMSTFSLEFSELFVSQGGLHPGQEDVLEVHCNGVIITEPQFPGQVSIPHEAKLDIVTNAPGSPASYSLNCRVDMDNGIDQIAVAGATLPKPLRVQYTLGGVPAVGFQLNWTVTSGGGVLASASTVTDSEGLGENTWTLGPVEGQQTAQVCVVAQKGGCGPTFTATAVGSIDLVAGEVLLLSNPGDIGSVVSAPEQGESVYLAFEYDINTPGDISTRLREISLDGAPYCSDPGLALHAPGNAFYSCPTPWIAAAGDHQIKGELDPDNSIAESDEDNNIASLNIAVETGSPDGPLCVTKTTPFPFGPKGGVLPDEFEPDDTQESARAIVIGIRDVIEFPQLHTSHEPTDKDWMKFHVNVDHLPGASYTFTKEQAVLLTGVVFELYDSSGALIPSFGDGGLYEMVPGLEVLEPPSWMPVETDEVFLCIYAPKEGGTGTHPSMTAIVGDVLAGYIFGKVTDAKTGLPVDLALLATDPSTSLQWSDLAGDYSLIGLVPGDYEVTVAAPGYETGLFPGNEVQEAEGTEVDFVLVPSSVAADQSVSGSYFDPSHNGEGWLLEILSEESKRLDGSKAPGLAVAYWFTYPPEELQKGESAQQAWMIGVGSISGDTITFTDATITDGPVFGPNFDPEAVDRTIWGDFAFKFNEDGTMDVTYAGPPEWGSGEFKASRIANLAGLEDGRRKITAINPGITGSWYDPSHDGEGWLIEVLEGGLAIVYWFSYDTNGNQAWWVGVGTVDGKTIRVDETEIPTGTVFGPAFDPDGVVRVLWGSMEFTFDSCDTGTMAYESQLPEYGSGMLNLERITTVAGLPCE